jgi:hypothetical protein
MAAENKERLELRREYAERFNEDILVLTMGRYTGGWQEFAPPLWGLVIVTDKGFRFHHFPHQSWLDAAVRATGRGAEPREKLIFIPKDRLVHFAFFEEKSWWRKLLIYTPPVLAVTFRDSQGVEADLRVEIEGRCKQALAAALTLPARGKSPERLFAAPEAPTR